MKKSRKNIVLLKTIKICTPFEALKFMTMKMNENGEFKGCGLLCEVYS